MFKQNPLVLAVTLASATTGLSTSVSAADTQKVQSKNYLEEVTIIGDKSRAQTLAGSAFVMDREDLAVFSFTDINQVLADAPGVYARAEEGFGLRPNIGIRGSGTSRSSKIMLMEDGVMVAPAPYSNPAAYYFPTTGRMSGVEVLKGTPALAYGPSTVGGAINFISTPIPSAKTAANLKAEYGEDNSHRVLGNIGGSADTFGWLIEGQQYGSDGFSNIDNSGADTGFDKQDVMAKLRFNTPTDGNARYQQLDIKLQYVEENSDQSYTGLTDADFEADADRRYGMTEPDEMMNDRQSISANYLIEVNDNLDVTAQAYYTEYHRNWFKLNKIDGESIGSIVDGANGGNTGYQDILDGSADADLQYKHNNRDYTSKGIELAADYRFVTGGLSHQLNTGVRVHRDEMDRFQTEENWQQINGELVYVDTNPVNKGSNNRIETAEANSFWAIDNVEVNEKLDLTLALRYENAKTERQEFAQTERSNPTISRNSVEEWLPGIAFTYQLNDSLQLLGGLHKGLAMPAGGSTEGIEPERSTNYELGGRFNSGDVSAELIAFYSDYESTVQNCSIAYPCDDGAEDGSYSLGESEVRGVEASFGFNGLSWQGISYPITAAYTYTNAEITDPAESGNAAGDAISYMPEDQLSVTFGAVGAGWSSHLRTSYLSASCSKTGCNQADSEFDETDRLFMIDFVARMDVTQGASAYFKLDNLMDERAIVSRSPYGARANRSRTALVGVDYSF